MCVPLTFVRVCWGWGGGGVQFTIYMRVFVFVCVEGGGCLHACVSETEWGCMRVFVWHLYANVCVWWGGGGTTYVRVFGCMCVWEGEFALCGCYVFVWSVRGGGGVFTAKILAKGSLFTAYKSYIVCLGVCLCVCVCWGGGGGVAGGCIRVFGWWRGGGGRYLIHWVY